MRNAFVSSLKSRPQWILVCSNSVLSLLLFASCLSVTAWCQDQATIVGVVSDSTSAVVTGAKVTVTNSQRGVKRETTSNSFGEYTVAKVPIGAYEITAEAAGFQKLVRTGLTVAVGQTLRVDLQLTVGEVTQEVTVSTGNVAVETQSGAVANVITGSQVRDLNLNGRNWMSLTTLMPGVAPMNENNFNPVRAGFGSSQLIVSFSGSRVNDSNVDMDGGNINNEPGGGRNNVVFPVIDSIAEVSISTSSYGADVGKRPGASIEIVTKGGTKDFHGTAYEFVRNDAMDANNFFLNRQITSNGKAFKQPLKWNIFGYNLGGPVTIPGLYNTDKSKTFFFWSQSWTRFREGTVVSGNVPSLIMRQGDFSECDPGSASYNPVVASGCRVPIDPATRLPFPGNKVSIDPNAAAMLNGLIPLPNNGPVGYISAPSLPNDWRQENIRVDHNIGAGTRIFGRYTRKVTTTNTPTVTTTPL